MAKIHAESQINIDVVAAEQQPESEQTVESTIPQTDETTSTAEGQQQDDIGQADSNNNLEQDPALNDELLKTNSESNQSEDAKMDVQ